MTKERCEVQKGGERMFCPFIKDECRADCVFRCRPRAASSSMMQDTLTCVLASRISEMNTEQQDQLNELIDSVRAID